MNKIAERGHLEVLKWARENGCQWDSMTCAHAAGGGWTFRSSQMGQEKWLFLPKIVLNTSPTTLLDF